MAEHAPAEVHLQKVPACGGTVPSCPLRNMATSFGSTPLSEAGLLSAQRLVLEVQGKEQLSLFPLDRPGDAEVGMPYIL